MWQTHSRVTDFAVTVVGTGASCVTDPSKLFNGRPAEVTRFQWLSTGSPSITDSVKIQCLRGTPFPAGFVGLLGFSVLGSASSAGVKMAFAGKRSGDTDFTYPLGGNSALQRTVQRSDRSLASLVVPDAGLDDIVGVQLTIWNDRNGSVIFTPSQFFDLGDLIASEGFDLDIDGDWKLTPGKNTIPTSKNDQPWPVPYPPGRTLTAARSQIPFSEAYIDGANPCWQSLVTLVGEGDASMMIPRFGAQGSLNVDSLHATAIFGLASYNDLDRGDGDIFKINFTSQEIPALLA